MENMDEVRTDQAKNKAVTIKSSNSWKWNRMKAPITFSKMLIDLQRFYVL